ncbi:sensor histidine kinase [Actinoplanes sp. CA-252034]|uniref:sensor histidine kinase n=1 Tax=Actinoplanes sp. CA-252034 TaxID=3239906 RepID=UPI003D9910DC
MLTLTLEGPDAEARRLAALHEYRVLDAPADDELNAVVRVAAMVADVPTASLNLIDENRQCQLTTVGFAGGDSERGDSMCDIAFRDGRVIHLPDARQHRVYAGNPWVDGRIGRVRFYASAPLISPAGYALGTLCVFDDVSKSLTSKQIHRLEDLAEIIVGLFERRRQARISAELAMETERSHRAIERAHEELRLAVRELERSNDELEGFAVAVSHDLVRPLASASGYLEMLGHLYGDRLDERGATWVSGAGRALERMQQLVRALLDYARAGHAPYRAVAVDLTEVIGQVRADLRAHTESTGATITVPGSLPVVNGDPTLLRQLLQNLIDNAIKYRHPDRAPVVEVGWAPAPGGCLIEVADNGLGIPPDQRERVFDMFAQVDPESRTGHGIGLSTCMRIVERHGGRIAVGTSRSGGTLIRLHLPAAGG